MSIRKATRLLAVVAVMIAASDSVHAAETYAPKAIADTIAPLVDWETYAIIRINTQKIDVEPFIKWIAENKVIGAESLVGSADTLKQWREGFLASGARDIFILRTTAEPADAMPTLIVPLSATAQPGTVALALRKPLQPGRRQGRGPIGLRGKVNQVRRFVVGSTNVRTGRSLLTVKPDPRPELADAFAAAGDVPIQVILVPSADHRGVMEAAATRLPPPMPPAPTTVVSKGLRWAGLGIHLPPKASMELIVQATDGKAAQALNDVVSRTLAALTSEPKTRELMPEIEKAGRIVGPQLSGSRLIVELDPKEVSELIRIVLVPIIRQAQQRARQAESMANLRAIGIALTRWADKHDAQQPHSLQLLEKEGLVKSEQIISPISGKPTYVYIRPAANAPDTTLVAYEDPAGHGMDRTAVLFAGANVTIVPVDEAFWLKVKKASAQSMADQDVPAPTPEPKPERPGDDD